MQQFLIVGVDISKLVLDVVFKPSGQQLNIPNTVAGFKTWRKQLRQLHSDQSVLVIMEHTGRYSHRFEKFLRQHDITYCKIASLEIKRSIGLKRGKSDAIDALRIAEYGWLRKDILQPEQAVQDDIRQLQQLLSYRAKLVRDQAGLKSRLKEILDTGTAVKTNPEVQSMHRLLQQFKKEIAQMDKHIKKLISDNASLHQTDQLLQSIKGVGWVVSAYMISTTNNFKKFSNARKFNCYAGLAPFTHSSGSSIKGRSRISHLANKTAKTVLSLAAFNAIRYNPELKQYYQRRLDEGKSKMSSVNVVRAKIVSRMFAVINRQTPYTLTLAA